MDKRVPGPDGASNNWPTHPLEKDAPRHRLAEDRLRLNGED
ncbi:hypothetical protein [Nocardia sp. SC052]